MPMLPSENTSLNQHSLVALETWLEQLGARKSDEDPCVWLLSLNDWSAVIKMEHDELQVTWEQDGECSHCFFSYGLQRKDVQLAITQGP